LARSGRFLFSTVLAVAALTVAGCGQEPSPGTAGTMNETADGDDSAAPIGADATSETRMEESSEMDETEAATTGDSGIEAAGGEPLPGSGVPLWTEGAVGTLVPGLDGAEYDAYGRELIGAVQEALSREGIYTGPLNRVFDQPTTEAIGEFQEANDIHVSGVPSPVTRQRLLSDNG
jgi:hypothetical protein